MKKLQYDKEPLKSWYETYRPLSYQETTNLKHKYDNRTYPSLRYKHFLDSPLDEIFVKRRNIAPSIMLLQVFYF
jgi:hypothetical protein